MSKMKTVNLTQAVTVTLDDSTKVTVPAGISAQPAAVADHWYVQAHHVKEGPPGPGTYEYAVALRKVADAKTADAKDAEAQAAEAEHLWKEAAAASAKAAAEAQEPEEGEQEGEEQPDPADSEELAEEVEAEEPEFAPKPEVKTGKKRPALAK